MIRVFDSRAWARVLCIGLGTSSLFTAPLRAEGPDPLSTAWEDAATFLFNEAHQQFESGKEGQPAEERERQLGEAVTLLNVQPRTRSNIDHAAAIFEQLRSGNPEDTPGVFATYFMARVHQFYDQPAQLGEARELYHELLEKHSGNVVAEAGAASLVLMDLYENVSDSERAKRFEDLEKIGPSLKTRLGRLGYHLNMGNAYIDFDGLPEKALEHLLAADADGIKSVQVESGTWIMIGELAETEKRPELALKYYDRFLSKYQRDNRHYMIRQRRDRLAGANSTAPPAPRS